MGEFAGGFSVKGAIHRSARWGPAVVILASMNLGARSAQAQIAFVRSAFTPIGKAPSAVAAGDLNGDGHQDLVVVNTGNASGQGNLMVLLGNGDGTFRQPVTYDLGPYGSQVALGDFNGDGRLDVAATYYGAMVDGSDGRVSVRLGNGDGTLGPATEYDVGPAPRGILATDVNGDGKLDLIVTAGNESGSIQVLLGNGDGTFAAPIASDAGPHPTAAVAAGTLGSGRSVDLIVTNSGSGFQVLAGDGTGRFQPGQSFEMAQSAQALALADVNGDGVPDLLVGNGQPSTGTGLGNLSVWLGRGDGGFDDGGFYPEGRIFAGVAVADFNGDGKPDVVTVDTYGTDESGGPVSVRLGNGDGTFKDPVVLTRLNFAFGMAVADFNGDGKPDLAAVAEAGAGTTGNGRLLVLINQTPWPSDGQAPVPGDVNGDGKVTVADATLALRIAIGLAIPTTAQVKAGDLNGDGKVDVADATRILRKAIRL